MIKNILNRIFLALIFVCISFSSYAAIPADAVWEVRSTATSGNVNGGGFNPSNANFLTDGAATSATGNAAVFTSASYNFVANDVGAKLFIKSGTNWNAVCWYNIDSVAANAATVNSTAGAGVCRAANTRFFAATTSAGVATTGSPTGATWGIDYSQQNAAAYADSDLTGTTTSATSALKPFTTQMVGNIIHLNSGTGVTAGWYEIVSVSGVTATLDRSAGASYSVVVFKTGGALSLNATGTGIGDTAFSAAVTSSTTAANRIFFKGPATYTIAQSWTPASGSTFPIIWEGYTSTRGDRPSIASGNQPTLALGSQTFNGGGTNEEYYNLSFTTAETNGIVIGNAGTMNIGSKMFNCKCRQTSTGICIQGGSVFFSDIMGGTGQGYMATGNGSTAILYGNFFHDSNKCVNMSSASTLEFAVINNVFAGCSVNGIRTLINGPQYFLNNTIYGAATPAGTNGGIEFGNSAAWKVVALNNIVTGYTTGVKATTLVSSITPYVDYNDYYNNTTNIDSAVDWQTGPHDLTSDPGFASLVVRSGTTATTTAGNHLVQSGATFQTWGIAAGDRLDIISGTGPTQGGYVISSVDSETQVTVDTTLTANASADKQWQIIKTSNLSPGNNMKGAGIPGLFPSSNSTSYLDIGGVQRQEAGGACTTGN